MTRTFSRIALLLLLVLPACGRQLGGTFDSSMALVGMCEVGDEQYPVGSTFPSSDGCNTCMCKQRPDGSIAVMCTMIYCSGN